MKNEYKIPILVLIIIITIFIFFIFGWIFIRKVQSEKQVPVGVVETSLETQVSTKLAEDQIEEVSKEDCNSDEVEKPKKTKRTSEEYFEGNIYHNKEFNFDIIFPESWKSFTTQVYIDSVENITMPLSEDDGSTPSYQSVGTSNGLLPVKKDEIERIDISLPLESRDSLLGVYNASVLSVYVSALDTWESIDCSDKSSYYCFRRPKEIGRNEKCVVEMKGPSYAQLELCSSEIVQDNDFRKKNSNFCDMISPLDNMIWTGQISVVFK